MEVRQIAILQEGDLDVDLETNRVYFTGQGFFAIEIDFLFNINGQLTGAYEGKPDQTLVTFSADLRSRHVWAEFSKDGGSGTANRVAVRGDKVVYLAQTNRGKYFTMIMLVKLCPLITLEKKKVR